MWKLEGMVRGVLVGLEGKEDWNWRIKIGYKDCIYFY